MHKFMKEYGKQIMAVLGVVLMVAFALPSAMQKGGGNDPTYATVNGQKVRASEFQSTQQGWEFLKRYAHAALVIREGNNPNQFQFSQSVLQQAGQMVNLFQRLGQAMPNNPRMPRYMQEDSPELHRGLIPLTSLLGVETAKFSQGATPEDLAFAERLGQEIDNNPDLYFLLVREARDRGIQIPDRAIENFKAVYLEPSFAAEGERQVGRDGGQGRERFNGILADFLAAQAHFDSIARSVKVSLPLRDQTLAENYQRLSVNVAEFDARDYLAKTPAPAIAAVEQQFEKYKNDDPDHSPSGYGYQIPDRLKFQYLRLRRDDLRQVVEPTLDDVAIADYVGKHQAELVTHPLPYLPPDAFHLTAQPRPNPLKSEPIPYLRALALVRRQLALQKADELAKDVVKFIAAQAGRDYAAFRQVVAEGKESAPAAPANGDPSGAAAPAAASAKAPASELGVPYNTYEYLQKLAARVEAKFHVTPRVPEPPAGWQTRADLEKFKPLADAELETGRRRTSFDTTKFPQYATRWVGPFVTDEQRRTATERGVRSVGVFELSPEFRGEEGDLFLFRATEAQKAHAAVLNDVLERVRQDTLALEALKLARAEADKLLAAAREDGLGPAAARTHTPVVATSAFTRDFPGRIEGVDLADDEFDRPAPFSQEKPLAREAKRQFVSTAFGMLLPAPEDRGDHRARLLELPQSKLQKVIVMELKEARPEWSEAPAAQGPFDFFAELKAREEYVMQLKRSWFDPQAVEARTGFKPEETRRRKSPNPAPRSAPVPPVDRLGQ